MGLALRSQPYNALSTMALRKLFRIDFFPFNVRYASLSFIARYFSVSLFTLLVEQHRLHFVILLPFSLAASKALNPSLMLHAQTLNGN